MIFTKKYKNIIINYTIYTENNPAAGGGCVSARQKKPQGSEEGNND